MDNNICKVTPTDVKLKQTNTGKHNKSKNNNVLLVIVLVVLVVGCAGIKLYSEYTKHQIGELLGTNDKPPESVVESTNNTDGGTTESQTTPVSYETEDERWDAENCIYANFKYGIAFQLPKDVAWHKVSGTSKHTIVKFVQPETQITLFVNCHKIEGASANENLNDIWDYYDIYTKEVIPMGQQAANKISAEQSYNIIFDRSSICGKHAIKVQYHSTMYDDRFDEPLELTTIDYVFFHNSYNYSVSLKCFDVIHKELLKDDFDTESLLLAFQLIPRNNEELNL